MAALHTLCLHARGTCMPCSATPAHSARLLCDGCRKREETGKQQPAAAPQRPAKVGTAAAACWLPAAAAACWVGAGGAFVTCLLPVVRRVARRASR
jgi:hypothetical protein